MPDHTRPQPRRYESIQQAAERVHVTTRSVRRWIAQGRLSAYRVGNRTIRLDADELDNMLTLIPTAGPVSPVRERCPVASPPDDVADRRNADALDNLMSPIPAAGR